MVPVCPVRVEKKSGFCLIPLFLLTLATAHASDLNGGEPSMTRLWHPEYRNSRVPGRTDPGRMKKELRRPATVADVIRMRSVVGPDAVNGPSGGPVAGFAAFSPDRKRFVIIVRKGNLEQNTVEYSLLLFITGEAFNHPTAKTLVSFASSSNRPEISDLTWLQDNDTILFLGQKAGETSQLYSVRCSTGKVRRLTTASTNLLEYSASAHGDEFAYVAERPLANLVTNAVLRSGFIVSNQSLADLIAGHVKNHPEMDYDTDLFVDRPGETAGTLVTVRGRLDREPIYLSPNGRYLIVKTNLRYVPRGWGDYKDALLQMIIRNKVPQGSRTWMIRYELVDMNTGKSEVLLNGPVSYYGSEVLWLEDSKSVVLTGVYLPLDVSNPAERAKRERGPVVVGIRLRRLKVQEISKHDLALAGWDPRTQTLRLKPREVRQGAALEAESFQFKRDKWEAVKTAPESANRSPLEILAKQDLNTPPSVVALNPETGREGLLLDLNPQFKDLAFGKVEHVRWSDGYGRQVEGGLYLPPDYSPAKQYPLVIQTHGFDPHAFSVDGPFSTAFAAQPLAGKGFVVLQVPSLHDWKTMSTPEEGPEMMRIYERGIAYLSARGIVDPRRVGIIGFSQTCYHVEYALTHSKFRFKAAVIADGLDMSYFQYIDYVHSFPYLGSLIENTNGAAPFGKGLPLWLERAPGFLLDRVQTPVRIQAIHPPSLLAEWELFAGLSRLGKAFDFVYIPDGYHVLQKPWDRLISQQGDVDWFCFWLKGEEDSNPSKAEQYRRWHLLRDIARRDLERPGVSDSKISR
jgi:hypothetical protein